MESLYTLVIGFLGGIIGALGTDFIRAPFLRFFALRTEIRHEMLRLANVAPPDRLWRQPLHNQETLDRLYAPIREAESTFRNLGTRMMAFADTEWIAPKCVKLLGYEPREAAQGLIDLSNSVAKQVAERAAHCKRINKALQFPN
jgi:hypothetical protein